MKITFIGADHEVTGSMHVLEACGKKILLDCGMEQGANMFENAELPFDEAMIDYVLLSHAHIDHSGLLPLIYARGFRGQIMATEATADLCSIMLRDSAHIQMQEAEWRNRKAKRSADNANIEPLYTMEDADGAIRRLCGFPYDEKEELCDGISFRFTDVGHLLGSASIEIWITENGVTKKLVFSGDIGNKKSTLIRDPQYVKDADIVIMESTYGNRLHNAEHPDYVSEIARIIDETLGRGGNLVVPAFAVGRTQEMLYYIREIKERKLVTSVPDFPVYVDSPLAVEATEVFKRNMEGCFSKEARELMHKGINPITFPNLHLSITGDESKMINFDSEPKVILSASGMCDAGRIRHHLKHNLWRPESTVLFVGYQAVGTLGRILVDGEKKEVKLFGEDIEVRAQIKVLAGMSGHADKNGLIEWLKNIGNKPEIVFVVHGDDESSKAFTETLRTEYGYDAYAPYSGTVYNMITGEFIYEAKPVPVKKKARRISDIFARLVAAGQRLMAVIYKNEGLSNKDMAKFADQINSLSDKWDRY